MVSQEHKEILATSLCVLAAFRDHGRDFEGMANPCVYKNLWKCINNAETPGRYRYIQVIHNSIPLTAIGFHAMINFMSTFKCSFQHSFLRSLLTCCGDSMNFPSNTNNKNHEGYKEFLM